MLVMDHIENWSLPNMLPKLNEVVIIIIISSSPSDMDLLFISYKSVKGFLAITLLLLNFSS